MKKRITLYSEPAYLIGLVLLAIGTALMEKAGLGMSMVVAPAYILHLWLSEYLPFFSFGMSGYLLQGVLLLLLIAVLRRPRVSYLFSFVTAIVYGLLLDGAIFLVSPLLCEPLWLRALVYLGGMPLCTAGIALLLRTYLSPEVYELIVKEVVARYGLPVFRVKTVYDLASFAVSVLLSFLVFGFGHLEGIGIGTVVSALFNGLLISLFDKLYTRLFDSGDLLPLRKYFE